MPSTTNPAVSYVLAASIGVAFVLWLFPFGIWSGLNVPDATLSGDIAQNIVGQRYFIADEWRWPLLSTRHLNTPNGISIAYTDSIPLAALLMKTMRGILPAGYTAMYPWLAFAYAAQPVAAVFALRCAGEKRLIPAILIGVFALSIPSFIFRFGHIGLSTHALLLVAIGLYFRIVGKRRAMPMATALLLAASLLIHPYLLAMVAAILAAAPLSLLVQRERAWRSTAVALAGGGLLTFCLILILDYSGEAPPEGYGSTSMNLLGPIYPAFSVLLHGVFPAIQGPIDATGNQGEGYQYLGVGLLLLIGAAVVTLCRQNPLQVVRRHAGLFLACFGIFLFSISNVVYFGHVLLFQVGPVPDFMHQFRSSGRFFWVVSYALLIGSAAYMTRALPYVTGCGLLIAVTTLQFIDTADLRGVLAASFLRPAIWTTDAERLRSLLAAHHRLTVWPTVACGADTNEPWFMPLMVAASETLIPINTMYVSREQWPRHCDAMDIVAQPLQPSELRVFSPATGHAATSVVPGGERNCRALGSMTVCTLKTELLDGLTPTQVAAFPMGRRVIASSPDGSQILGVGWSGLEPDGVWSGGHDATLIARFERRPTAPVTLTVWGYGFSGLPDWDQDLTISVNGQQVAIWRARNRVEAFHAVIPAEIIVDGANLVRLAIKDPARPIDLGVNRDVRALGFMIKSFEIDDGVVIDDVAAK